MNTLSRNLLLISAVLFCSNGLNGFPSRKQIYEKKITEISIKTGIDTQNLIDNSTTFETKRIWVYVSGDGILQSGSSLYAKTKQNLFSSEGDYFKLLSYSTTQNATFYYFDIGLEIYGFKVSVLDETTKKETTACEWIYRPEPTFVYEVTNDVPSKIRQRNLDLGWNNRPDAFLLGLLLSSFSSYSPSYENGYGGYLSLSENWLPYYRGNDEDLSSTHIFDYTEEEYNSHDQSVKKTRVVSIASKIEELKTAYSLKPSSKKKSGHLDMVIEVSSLCIVSGLSLLFLLLLNKHAKAR